MTETTDARLQDLRTLMTQLRGFPPARIADAAWEWMEAQGFRSSAHTPTDDEQVTVDVEALDRGWGTLDQRMAGTILAVIAHYGPKWREASGGDQANEITRALQAGGFNRPPEPGSRLDLAFREELVAYSKNRIAESWGESVNGVDAETLARQIIGAQEWMWIARGFPVEPTEVPEPSAGWSSEDRREALGEALRRWSVQSQHDRVDQRDHDLYGMGARQGFALGAEWWKASHLAPEPKGEPSDSQVADIEQRVYDENKNHIAGMAKALVRAGWDAALSASRGVR